MSKLEFQVIEEGDAGMALRSAILVYEGSNNSAFVTAHKVHHGEGGEATILAGRPMTPLALAKLAKRLTKRNERGGFVPPTLIYQDLASIAWWVPPSTRHIWFRCERGELGAVERGEAVPHPGLVFAVGASRSWRVWAVKGAARPTEDTPVFRSPYFNVYSTAEICQGNVDVPSGTTADKIAAWNKAFFESYFTHPNGDGSPVKYRGGPYKFWSDMLDGRHATFPESALVPMERTLAQVLTKGKHERN